MVENGYMESIKQNFREWGFEKLTWDIIQKVADIMSGGMVTSVLNNNTESEEINNLVTFYKEQKYNQFLENGFRQLNSEDKITWLKQMIANSEFRIHKTDLHQLMIGFNFAAKALIKIYADSDIQVRKYIDSTLKEVFLVNLKEPEASFAVAPYLLEL